MHGSSNSNVENKIQKFSFQLTVAPFLLQLQLCFTSYSVLEKYLKVFTFTREQRVRRNEQFLKAHDNGIIIGIAI